MSPLIEAELRKIVRHELATVLQQYGVQMRQDVISAILPSVHAEAERQVAALIPPVPVLDIRVGKRRPRRVYGHRHRVLPQLLRMATARTPQGFPLPLWLYGPPGSGKSTIAEQMAEGLSAKLYLVPLGPTSTESKLIGYTNLVTGQFIPGLLYGPFKHGGLAFLDEVDVADPGVLVGMNALISTKHFRFPDGEVVERHLDFFLVAGANTIGTGGADGLTRNKLDAAFLDRFVKVKVDYDSDLEAAACGNASWAAYVQKVRHHLQQIGGRLFNITPRAAINGAALLAAGVPAPIVVDTVLLPGCADELKRTITTQVGTFIP